MPYIWNNKQQESNIIKVRLDMGLGDDKFLEKFDSSMVRHIQTIVLCWSKSINTSG
jgi:hypothetical protein